MTAVAVADDQQRETADSATILQRALSLDFTRPLAFAALALIYVASRLPWINVGYGTDPDAWRVALSGYWLWEHHEFYPSRLPGYPLHEYASAAVSPGGHLATNGLTLLVSLGGLWLFAAIVRELRLPNRGLVVGGFAFTPLLWINSMNTMDYMWALTFILGAYYLLMRGEVGLAGVVLGLAVASRLTSLLFIVPFVIYIWRDGRQGELRDFVVWTLFVPLVFYLPIAWRYGADFIDFYDASIGYLSVARLLAKDTLGIFGAIAVLIALVVSLPRLVKLPVDAVRDKDVMLWVVAIGIVLMIFARLPHESAYLIPLYPFGFLVMARYFQRWVLAGAVAAIVLAGFVDITTPGDEISLSDMREARIGRGLVLSNAETMRLQLDFVDDIEALEVQQKTVVSLGFIYPHFAVLNRDRLEIGILEEDTHSISQLSDKGKATDTEREIVYVWLLDYQQFVKFRDQGYAFRATQDANRSTVALYDYRPALVGARIIDLGRGPSGGSGAARTDR